MAHAAIKAQGKDKTRVFSEIAAVLVFGHHSECERLQKRWVSLRPSNFVRNWSARAVRFNVRVVGVPALPNLQELNPPRPPLVRGGICLTNQPTRK